MKRISINLGSGYRKLDKFINIDNREITNPDMVADLSDGMPFKDNSIDLVQAFDFLEHLEREEVYNLVNEIWRVLKPKGRFFHQTPSTSGRGAHQDPFHKSFWNINTWRFYFTDPAYRKLYDTKANFKIVHLEDVITDRENRVVHTICMYECIK